MNGPLGGIKVVASETCYLWDTWQARFPRSKKHRIRKKWSRNRANWVSKRTPMAYQIGDTIFCAPEIVEQLRAVSVEVAP